MGFFLHWLSTATALWAASHIFRGLHFADTESLLVSALVLGFANAIVRPLLFILTLPFTLITLGLFLFVVNALTLELVSALVDGFALSGFGTAILASSFISLLSWVMVRGLRKND